MEKTITLTVVTGPNSGRSVAVKDGNAPIIGRASSADFSIMDPRMSREHFRLVRKSEGWAVQDLSSRNGTELNSEKADRLLLLRDGDVIVAGDTTFRVDM